MPPPETRETGEKLVKEKVESLQESDLRIISSCLIEEVRSGKRDCLI